MVCFAGVGGGGGAAGPSRTEGVVTRSREQQQHNRSFEEVGLNQSFHYGFIFQLFTVVDFLLVILTAKSLQKNTAALFSTGRYF
jgi:hypothetical protein